MYRPFVTYPNGVETFFNAAVATSDDILAVVARVTAITAKTLNTSDAPKIEFFRVAYG